MFEIEKMENEFDYSLVDNETADFLRSCEYEINGITEDARIKVGGVLLKARDKLGNNKNGVFQKWLASGRISKDDAYYYINLNISSRNLDNIKLDNFLNAPKSLQKETMKKSAPEDMKQKVFDGDIKTHKEYKEELKRREEAEQKAKEFEQRAKQAESQAENERKERERLEEELENQEPERIEVAPDDYDYYKGNYKAAVGMKDRYKEQMEEMRKELEKANDKFKHEYDIEGAEKKKEYLQIQADINVLNLANNIDEFLKENAVTSYREGAIASSDDTTKETIRECVKSLKNFANEIERSLQGRIKV